MKLWALADFARLLGPIDTPAEAWLMMRTRSDMPVPKCNDASQSGYRLLQDGYEIREQHGTHACHPLEISESRYQVTRDGRVREISTRVVRSDLEACIVD